MKRVIVNYTKLTHEILNLLVDKFPDGYDDSNIIRFRNAKNELIEAVEVKTEDTIYLVKVSTKLADRLENYDEEDELANEIELIIPMKEDDEDEDDEDEEYDNFIEKPEETDEEDKESEDNDFEEDFEDEDDEDEDDDK